MVLDMRKKPSLVDKYSSITTGDFCIFSFLLLADRTKYFT